ncbi:uncharacterized protein LOC143284285 [Babylonia areolata]|uniref:uncharacterized protein LOC143284285 n=1 Tax=Babylonia areolata TaxID=304850 RepID=UPI003FD1BC91
MASPMTETPPPPPHARAPECHPPHTPAPASLPQQADDAFAATKDCGHSRRHGCWWGGRWTTAPSQGGESNTQPPTTMPADLQQPHAEPGTSQQERNNFPSRRPGPRGYFWHPEMRPTPGEVTPGVEPLMDRNGVVSPSESVSADPQAPKMPTNAGESGQETHFPPGGRRGRWFFYHPDTRPAPGEVKPGEDPSGFPGNGYPPFQGEFPPFHGREYPPFHGGEYPPFRNGEYHPFRGGEYPPFRGGYPPFHGYRFGHHGGRYFQRGPESTYIFREFDFL